MASRSVGIRELKNQTSRIIAQVRAGHVVEVTDRRRVVALILPAPTVDTSASERLLRSVPSGRVTWGGKKPTGLARPTRVKGDGVARAVIEDRR